MTFSISHMYIFFIFPNLVTCICRINPPSHVHHLISPTSNFECHTQNCQQLFTSHFFIPSYLWQVGCPVLFHLLRLCVPLCCRSVVVNLTPMWSWCRCLVLWDFKSWPALKVFIQTSQRRLPSGSVQCCLLDDSPLRWQRPDSIVVAVLFELTPRLLLRGLIVFPFDEEPSVWY